MANQGDARIVTAAGKRYLVSSAAPITAVSKSKTTDEGFRTGVPPTMKQWVGFCDALIYDCTSPISSATEDTFFQVSVGGQLSGSSTVKKSLLHTNLKQSGQIPSDERFEVHGYGMWITPLMLRDADYATVVTLVNSMINGYVTIKFRGYRDIDYPITAILSQHVGGAVAIAGSSGAQYAAWFDSPFNLAKGYKPLTKPIILSRSVPVEVKVEWPTAPNASGTNALLLYFAFFGIREFAVVA